VLVQEQEVLDTVSWTQLQNFKEKHAIPLGGVRIINAVLCEGFSISLHRFEYQED